jgi:hypothetical protein
MAGGVGRGGGGTGEIQGNFKYRKKNLQVYSKEFIRLLNNFIYERCDFFLFSFPFYFCK